MCFVNREDNTSKSAVTKAQKTNPPKPPARAKKGAKKAGAKKAAAGSKSMTSYFGKK